MVGEKKLIITIDAGGTMTDCFIADEEGRFTLGKALTNYEDESISYLESVADACSYWEIKDDAEAHKLTVIDVYTGTLMLNALLTGKTGKVGLIVTKGQESMYIHERGHSWLGMDWFDVLHHKTHKHVGAEMFKLNKKLVKGVSERISSGSYFFVAKPGSVQVPLNEEEVKKAVNELLDEGVKAIGIVFMFSYLNPEHEKRAAEIAREIIKERGLDVDVITSSELIPVMKEVQRLKSVLIEASLGRYVRGLYKRIEDAAHKKGYKYDLYTVSSYGSIVNATKHPRMFETLISGPVGGIMGAKYIGDLLGIKNIFTADIGGTSFDVGTIINGEIIIRKEPDFAKNRLALPMIAIDSIGAGAGSVIHIDEFKHVSVGPDSAGSNVGVCFKWPDPTISDCNLVLGTLNPDYFLGGKVKLDKTKSERELQRRVADVLGLDLYDAAWGVVQILHNNLTQHMLSMIRARGADPRAFALFMYGGAGPLHLYGIDVDFGRIMTFPFAAVFSAFGIAAADFSKRFHQGVSIAVLPNIDIKTKQEIADYIGSIYTQLENRALKELESEGFSTEKTRINYGASMRYFGTLDFIDVDFPFGKVKTAEDLDKAIETFNLKHASIYGKEAGYPESGYFISELYVEVFVEKPKPVFKRYTDLVPTPPSEAFKGEREVYLGRWVKATVYEMDLLKAGNRIDGPAIIEHPMTTLVIPPNHYAVFDEYRFINFVKRR